MSKLEKELLSLITKFEADNWRHITAKNAPKPSSNQFDFADFCNWLHDRK